MDIATGFGLAPLIVSTCIGFSGQYNAACNSALSATAKQTGIEKSVNDAQNVVSTYADRKAKYYIGEKPMSYIGSVLFIKKIADERKMTLNLPHFMLYDSANTELSENSYKLNLQWNF